MNAAIFKQLQRPVLKMLDVGFLKLQSLSIGIYILKVMAKIGPREP
jgi:hypothetical protein